MPLLAELDSTAADAKYGSIIGNGLVEDEKGSHVEYIIVSRRDDASKTIVQRRFSDFDRLRQELTPFARRKGLTLPKFPSKFGLRTKSSAFAEARQQALQEWMAWVVAREEYWTAPLAVFLAPASSSDTGGLSTDDRSDEGSPPASPPSSGALPGCVTTDFEPVVPSTAKRVAGASGNAEGVAL